MFTRPLRAAIAGVLTLGIAVTPLAQAQVRLPALGETASEDFTAGTERKLGEQIMRDVMRDPDFLDDPLLLEYLQSLWAPLVAAARARGEIDPDISSQFAWEVFLVRDRNVNAFALPGGWVGVYLGLIALTQTSDELASVLAHELTHVTQRHIARGIVHSQRQTLLGMAGLILAILAASRSNNADAVNAAVMGSQAVALQGQLNFSRDMEREADRVGFTLLTDAGFAGAGMGAMFDRLDSANRINDSGAFPYLRSHPLTTERMSEARSRQLLATLRAGQTVLPHALMQGRARVLMDTNPQNLRRMQEGAVSHKPTASLGERVSQVYSATLASSMLREHAAAERGLDELRQLLAGATADADTLRQLQLLHAQLHFNAGNPAGSIAVLQAIDSGGASRATMLMRAQAALAWQQQRGGEPAAAELRQSTEALQVWLAEHKRDATAWAALSSTAGAIGLRLRSLRAHAEARAAEGDLGGAIDRLRAAQTASRGASVGQDFIEASIIDARLRDLMAQRRQLALEMRSQQRGPRAPDGDTSEAPRLATEPVVGLR
jgi:predicted Zn-dependent protease